MRPTILLSLALSAGCFDLGTPPLRCSAQETTCPDGLVCVGEMCQSPTNPPTGDLGTGKDGAMVQPGCADGKGFAVGTKGAWACPGTWAKTAPRAAALCATGFHVCANSNLVSESECLTVNPGFYIAEVFGSIDETVQSSSQCMMSNKYNPVWYGCGPISAAPADKSYIATAACNGFRAGLHCAGTNGLSCPTMVLDDTTNTKATNGVLCCPN